MRRTAQRHLGFVLLEILLTVIILSGSLALIIQSMTITLRGAHQTQEYMTALFLMEDKLNALLEDQRISSRISETNDFPEPNDKYQYVLTTKAIDIVEIPDELKDNVNPMNEIDLQVAWTSGSKKKKMDFTTYLFNEK